MNTSRNEGEGPGTESAGQSAAAIMKRLGPASVLAVAAVTLPPLGGFLVLGFMDPIAKWLESHGGSGLAIYTVAFAVLTGLALLPTYAQAILGGWAFGMWTGFGAALLGFTGGALIGFGVARPTAGDRVVKLIEERPKWAAVRDALVPSAAHAGGKPHVRGGGFWRTLWIIVLLRLPPQSPFAITNLVLSSVRVPLTAYIIGTVVGMMPRTLAAVWLGNSLQTQFASVEEGIRAKAPWWYLGVGIVLVMIVLAIIGMIANKAIERVTRASNAA